MLLSCSLCLMLGSVIIRNKSINLCISILCQFLSTLPTGRKCSTGLFSGARSPSTLIGSRCSYLTFRHQVLCQGKLFSSNLISLLSIKLDKKNSLFLFHDRTFINYSLDRFLITKAKRPKSGNALLSIRED